MIPGAVVESILALGLSSEQGRVVALGLIEVEKATADPLLICLGRRREVDAARQRAKRAALVERLSAAEAAAGEKPRRRSTRAA